MNEYKPRIADRILKRKLADKGAVLIEGAKWCGKTTTAEQCASSAIYLDDPNKQRQYFAMGDIAPSELLKGATPRLIDEWQLIPKLWDAIRFKVDHRGGFGQFILTGSSVPVSSDLIHHTGTGRFAWVLMRPMSLFESGESTGGISLKSLFDGTAPLSAESSNLSLERIAFIACRGGWPEAIGISDDSALNQAYDYYDAMVRIDISRVDGIARDPMRAEKLMRSLARNQGTQATLRSICNDVFSSDASGFGEDTARSYISALRKMFVVEDMPAWNPNLRSKIAIRSSSTRYFVDPSIAAASLSIGPNNLLADLHFFGFLFETLCVRDLRIYADVLGGKVYHYRDRLGDECDAVVHLRDGKYGLIEIKLGGDSSIDEGARSLLKIANKIDAGKMGAPSFMMVLTAVGDYAYKRKDGVFVTPIGCLRD